MRIVAGLFCLLLGSVCGCSQYQTGFPGGPSPHERVMAWPTDWSGHVGQTVTLEGTVQSIVPMTKVALYSNGRVFKEIALDKDSKTVRFREQVNVSDSRWFSLYSEGPPSHYLDAEYPLAVTNVIRVYVGDQKIRDRESAEYFVRWIDKLRASAAQWPWWRSQHEKEHVFAQFDEARSVYQKLADEAR